jgi:threonyl-tRNA synthetase
MIHHAIFGSLGRMIAILLEHHGGVLPFWLSPDPVNPLFPSSLRFA